MKSMLRHLLQHIHVGEEVVWLHENPVWSMNYVGRVIGENFSGDFLKEVLMQVPAELPFRGPEIYIFCV